MATCQGRERESEGESERERQRQRMREGESMCKLSRPGGPTGSTCIPAKRPPPLLLTVAAARRLVAPPCSLRLPFPPPPCQPWEQRGRQAVVCYFLSEPPSLSLCAAVWNPPLHTETSSHAWYVLSAFKVATHFTTHRKEIKKHSCKIKGKRPSDKKKKKKRLKHTKLNKNLQTAAKKSWKEELETAWKIINVMLTILPQAKSYK